MNKLISSSSSKVTMSSTEIAELTGKHHKHVLEDCRKMFKALNIQSADFSADYKDSKGRVYYKFLLDQDLTMTLVMGYSIALRHKVAKRWRELEEKVKQPQLPQTFIEALEALLESKKNEEALALKIEQDAPKVAFVDSYVDAEGLLAFRQVSKLLEVPEATLRSFLTKKRYTYKLNGCWMFNKYFVDQGYGCIKTFTTEWGNAKTSIKFTPRGVEMLARYLNK